jgi:hypothetical protein
MPNSAGVFDGDRTGADTNSPDGAITGPKALELDRVVFPCE